MSIARTGRDGTAHSAEGAPSSSTTHPSHARVVHSIAHQVQKRRLLPSLPTSLSRLARSCSSMPAGGSSFLATMGRRRSFSYHRLKKLPTAAPFSPPHPPATTTAPTTGLDQGRDPPCATAAAAAAAAIEESYRSYYRALVARGRRRQQQQQPWRGSGRPRPRRRLRVWGALARALRRRAAAAGARVRASVARVARRLKEGRPYVGDLFAGNYMFLQVSPTMAGAGADVAARGAVVPFAEYYYECKARARAAAGAGAAAVQMHPAAAAAVLYKV